MAPRPKPTRLRCDSDMAGHRRNCHNERPCRHGRRSSTSTATTCVRAAVALRSPPSCACSPRSASPRRRCARRSPGWSGRAGCTRCGCPPAPATSSRRRRSAGSTTPAPASTAPAACPGTARSTCSSSNRRPPARSGSGSPPTSASSGTARSTPPPGWRPARPTRWSTCSTEAGVRLRAVHRRPHRRPVRRDGAGAARLGPAGARRRVRAVRPRRAAARRGPPRDDEAAYLARFTLVHRWRTFLFRDPQLPPVLLPRPLAGCHGRGVLRPPRRAPAPGRRPFRRPVPGRRPAPARARLTTATTTAV